MKFIQHGPVGPPREPGGKTIVTRARPAEFARLAGTSHIIVGRRNMVQVAPLDTQVEGYGDDLHVVVERGRPLLMRRRLREALA